VPTLAHTRHGQTKPYPHVLNRMASNTTTPEHFKCLNSTRFHVWHHSSSSATVYPENSTPIREGPPRRETRVPSRFLRSVCYTASAQLVRGFHTNHRRLHRNRLAQCLDRRSPPMQYLSSSGVLHGTTKPPARWTCMNWSPIARAAGRNLRDINYGVGRLR